MCPGWDQENAEGLGRLESSVTSAAPRHGFDLTTIPMPDAVYEGPKRLPATYMNFLISNHAVIVPVYGHPQDAEAVGRIGEFFSDRPTIGLRANALVFACGAFHCLSQQVPLVGRGEA